MNGLKRWVLQTTAEVTEWPCSVKFRRKFISPVELEQLPKSGKDVFSQLWHRGPGQVNALGADKWVLAGSDSISGGRCLSMKRYHLWDVGGGWWKWEVQLDISGINKRGHETWLLNPGTWITRRAESDQELTLRNSSNEVVQGWGRAIVSHLVGVILKLR